MHEIEFSERSRQVSGYDMKETTLAVAVKQMGRENRKAEYLYGVYRMTGPAIAADINGVREAAERKRVLDELIQLYVIYHDHGWDDNVTYCYDKSYIGTYDPCINPDGIVFAAKARGEEVAPPTYVYEPFGADAPALGDFT